MITHGQKIVVPKPAQPEILWRLHLPHSGQVKTLTQAHQLYYWKGMTGHINQMVASCVPCREHVTSQAHEPTRELLSANAPMETISMDLFYTGAPSTGFWDTRGFFSLQKLDTRAVIQCLQKLMNSLGYPRMVFSDNRPQFRGYFTGFCQQHPIEHKTSSPDYPSSNRLAESAVKPAK